MDQRNDSPQQRLSLLELLLIWEGRIYRSRVCELFGIGLPRSSQWIKEIRDLNPTWMQWDSKSRSYNATADCYKRFAKSKASQAEISESLSKYLSMVGLPYASAMNEGEGVMWSAVPSITAPSPRIFSCLGTAIRQSKAVDIEYMSLSEPAPHRRVIYPHSLVLAGRRWHVRAYSEPHQEFRDYALGRIIEVKPLAQISNRNRYDDLAWNTKVTVRLVAHPELSPEQARVIQAEYFRGTASRVETCRAALVPYFIQDVRAAMDTQTQHAPDYLIAVENAREVSKWLFNR
ncbi:helix-turn-helix transcriptional regulator [Thiobacillus denitrificans]|uniref:helix-turn-helix transcriptional regulator n=1 Tax=Thiobacillus denitrificans TaxID=36861 RepID=UPI0012FC456C|nr:WYL domain-containing protein [Thiobacillus denitrificans]